MTTTPATKPHARAPALIRLLNPLMRKLGGLGMPMGPNVLFTVRGRTSGLPRTFPVALLELGERRFVQSPFGEVEWVRNLRVSGEAVVSRGRQQERLEAAELTPEVGGVVLRDALAPYFTSRLRAIFAGFFFKIRRDSTLEAYVAEARRHPMFELRPATSPAPGTPPSR